MLAATVPSPVAAQSRDITSYVLLATRALHANGLRVTAGDVGVNAGSLSSATAFEAPGSQVVGDRVQLTSRASCGLLFANTLFGESAPGCGSPLPFASPIFDDIEAACGFPNPLPSPECEAASPIRLQGGGTLRLGPGVYGDLVVQGGAGGVDEPGTVVLTGGAYRFCRVLMRRNARLLVEAPSSVYVRESVVFGVENRVGPADATSLTARDVEVFVRGSRARVGRGSDVRARLCAPGAVLSLRDGATIEGNLAAEVVRAHRIVAQLDRTIVTTTTTSTSTSSTSSSSTSTSSTSSSTSTTSTSTSTSTSTTSTLPPPRCGDGVVNQPSEQCDDGNDRVGDCCSPACRADPDGIPCADAEVCNGDEVCQGGVCAAPSPAQHLACLEPNGAAFVSNFDADTISVVDAATRTVTGTLSSGDGPWAVGIHPSGREIYVTERLANHVTVVDTAAGGQLARIPVGRLPLGIDLDARGERAYVANFDDDTVSVIDTATRGVVATIAVGKGPAGLAFGPAGTRLYVSSWAGNSLSVVDVATNTVVDRIPTQKRPLQMALDAARGRLYIVNFASGTVSIVGTVSRTLLTTIRVGKNPFGIAVDGTRSRAYVSNAASDTVSVIDTATCGVLTDVPVGRGPLGVGLDLSGRTVFVANTENDNVSVLDGPAASAVTTLPVGDTPIAFGPFIGPLPNDCPRAARTCDDADPSTNDTCATLGTCEHVQLDPSTAVRAGLGAIDAELVSAPAGALGETRAQVAQALRNARSQLIAGETSGGLGKRLRRVGQRLGRVSRAIRKGLRRGTVQCDVGLRLLDLARGTQHQVRLALGLRRTTAPAAADSDEPRPEAPLASLVARHGR